MSKTAMYGGHCPACGDDIVADLDEIEFSDAFGAFVHEGCKDDEDELEGDFAGFGQQSRAGRMGVRETLADKVKAGKR